MKLLRISEYASVSTPKSVLIIGGYIYGQGSLNTIREYKDDRWTALGQLKQRRYGHIAISIGSSVIISGGYPDK